MLNCNLEVRFWESSDKRAERCQERWGLRGEEKSLSEARRRERDAPTCPLRETRESWGTKPSPDCRGPWTPSRRKVHLPLNCSGQLTSLQGIRQDDNQLSSCDFHPVSLSFLRSPGTRSKYTLSRAILRRQTEPWKVTVTLRRMSSLPVTNAITAGAPTRAGEEGWRCMRCLKCALRDRCHK